MSITTTAPHEDEYADRWRKWQLANGKSNRRSSIQARVAIALVLTAAAVWLALQLVSSPAWA
jgi:hypothetical protein